ncbi:hypothetical protein BDA99DRAFT_519029 [Phascolomyces articulosus]|uniref:Dynamin-binding protein n=1 Tax=Phascolomyces articulosus TaxID=60185 RepID=A0AAD5K4B4_9FUNG|nr:hypothetical protein BDA99DRAFT_519029 [Phascolomyces articulosus]
MANSDAFSSTLESRPRHRGPAPPQNATGNFPHRDGSVNRLSRVFEHDTHSHSNLQPPPPQQVHVQPQPVIVNRPYRPALPTKPPSLRISSSSNHVHHAIDSQLPSPSSESPASTVATSVTSFHSQEDNGKNNDIDQTPLAFADIRARFQQKEQQQPQQPIFPTGTTNNTTATPTSATAKRPLSSFYYNTVQSTNSMSNISTTPSNTNTTIRRSSSINTSPPLLSQQPPALPSKRLTHIRSSGSSSNKPVVAPRPLSSSSYEENNNNDNVPKTGSFVTELSNRLEQAEIIDDHDRQQQQQQFLRQQGASSPLPPPPPPHHQPVIPASTPARPPTILRRPSSSPRSSVLRKTRNNSSDSNSTPNLHIPVIARTGTGNSTTSTSSASSSLYDSPSKRAWHYGNTLSSWFNGQPQQQQQPSLKDSITVVSKEPLSKEPSEYSLPVSPQLSGNVKQGGGNQKLKRSKVIQELVMTEKVYQSDMLLVKQVYYDGAFHNSPLDKSDIKILFSNLVDILQLEEEFVDLLESAAGNMDYVEEDDDENDDNGDDRIGMAFRQMMSQIDHVYCEYCKRHEDAVLRLQELDGRPDVQEFFNDCREQTQGKTTSWDLGSMLIKPVQRVLKYPLLLREIFSLTPVDHPDHANLAAATQEIQEVADHINEIKRRKDIVEKIVGDKKKTDINLTRRAQRFKQVTGFSAEATQDASFDALHMRFEEQQFIAQQLARDVQGWVRQVKNHFEMLRLFAENAEVLYASWGGVRVKSMNGIRDFYQATDLFATVMTRELDTKVQGRVQSRIDSFLKVFENPAQVINKRAQKLLDYDRVRDIKSKGDVPDKALQDSADAYVSINAQLVDELPKFFQLTSTYFDVLIGELASVQTSFYEQMAREWHKVVQRHYAIHNLSTDTIMAEHMASMQAVDNLIYDITPLNRDLWESVPGAIPETPPPHTVGLVDDASSINGSSTRSAATIGSPYYDNYFP